MSGIVVVPIRGHVGMILRNSYFPDDAGSLFTSSPGAIVPGLLTKFPCLQYQPPVSFPGRAAGS